VAFHSTFCLGLLASPREARADRPVTNDEICGDVSQAMALRLQLQISFAGYRSVEIADVLLLGFVDHPPILHRPQHLGVSDFVRGDGQDVAIDQHEISLLSGSDRTNFVQLPHGDR
jgi:hypothetical protein